MLKRIGVLALLLSAGTAALAPTAAFAQDYRDWRRDYREGNRWASERDRREWREQERREARREREWRKHEWRERERAERYYRYAPNRYYGSGYYNGYYGGTYCPY